MRLRSGDTVRVPGFEVDIDFVPEGMSADEVTTELPTAGATQAPPESLTPVAAALAPVTRFWRGFTGLERFLIWTAIACAVLLAICLQLT